MATPKWVAGTLYPTGSLVQPLTGGGATSTAITNPGFESGTTDWTLGPSMATDTANPFAGVNALRCTGTAGWNEVVHDESPVNPGQSITATCMYQQGGASTNQNTGMVFLRWYTAAMALISDSDGSLIVATEGDHYKQSSVTAVAPSGAAFVSIGGKTNRTNSPDSRFDNFAWNYAQAVAPAGLIYKAVQPTIGTSGATEPTWPLSVGLTVVDNTVTWEALVATRITYEASPILLSGATEPTWPESIGEFVADNTISWKAVPQQVVEAPQSKVVTIASSKVYAADGDIVRYCATVNPLDWTSADDAGYLPTGLNQYGSNRTAVLNTYRGNVVPFSASTFLCYQADPDPANITQLDAMEGVGSTYQQAAHPVANDLFYLSPLGVRTVGIAVGTANLSAGDAGAPIDPLVQAALQVTGVRPMSAYYPNEGQYWVCMRPPLPVVVGPTVSGAAPDSEVDGVYPGFAYTVTPGDAPISTITISSGTFPPGLEMDNDGVIDAGPPTQVGTFDFVVTAMDENGLEFDHPDSIYISPIPGVMMAAPSGVGPIYSTDGGKNWAFCVEEYVFGSELLYAIAPNRFMSVTRTTDDLGATAWNVPTIVAAPGTTITQRGDYVLMGANGPFQAPAVSSDLWENVVNAGATGNALYSLVYCGDTGPLVGVGNVNGMFMASTDNAATFASTGVAHGLSTSNTSNACRKFSGGAVFAGINVGGTGVRVVFTPDGTSVKGGDIPSIGQDSSGIGRSSSRLSVGMVDNREVVVVLNTSGQMMWTYVDDLDALDWQFVDEPLGAGVTANAIEFNGVRFVLGGSIGGVGVLKYGDDLVNWTDATFPPGCQTFFAIASQEGQF